MADDDDQKVLEAAKKLPLSEQTQHKNWKVRSQAFDAIKQTCDRALGDEDPALAEFGKPHQNVSVQQLLVLLLLCTTPEPVELLLHCLRSCRRGTARLY